MSHKRRVSAFTACIRIRSFIVKIASIFSYENSNYYIYFVSNNSIVFIYVVSNNYQYRRLLIVIIKGYDFKEATLSSFDSTDDIYQAAKNVVGRETPILKPTM